MPIILYDLKPDDGIFKSQKKGIEFTCKSGTKYQIYYTLIDEPIAYNPETGKYFFCTETDTPDSIECMMKFFGVDEKTAKTYLHDPDDEE